MEGGREGGRSSLLLALDLDLSSLLASLPSVPWWALNIEEVNQFPDPNRWLVSLFFCLEVY